MLGGDPRVRRLLAAPMVVLGLVAVFYLARGPQPSRDQEALFEHLQRQGFTVRVFATPLANAFEEGYKEVEGRVTLLEIDGHRAQLNELKDVPGAMTLYKAEQSDSGFALEDVLGLPPVQREWYRCDNYVLRIDAPAAMADKIGLAFEGW